MNGSRFRPPLADALKSVVYDVLFPARCLSCGADDSYLCPQCFASAEPAKFICPACGGASFTGERHIGCGRARDGLDGLISVWRYGGAVREAVSRIKYECVKDALFELVARSVEAMEADWTRYERFAEFARSAVFTYVPMRVLAEGRRGFNQAEIIAGELGGRFDAEVAGLLCKNRRIVSQARLDSSAERAQNVRGAFAARQVPVPERVVLADDVWTTGATMKECARALRKSGARFVWGFTLAMAR